MSIESKLLSKERKKTTFNIEELTNLFDGGPNETKLRHYYENLVKSDPVMKENNVLNLNREEGFVAAIKRTVYFYQTYLKNKGLNPDDPHFNYIVRALGIEKSFIIHTTAFIGGLIKLGSDEQVRKWVPLASKLNIIGAYAQTELGHGTFLRGLEATATYYPGTQQFVINCPYSSSMKWWPGNIGVTANHVLLMAQLVLNDKKMGMHPFIVQIRDLSTHMPLKGVCVGDIGSKLGDPTNDNGYLYLKNLIIPRKNLLCKNAEVKPDGSYVKKVNDKMMYGSMVGVRVNMVVQDTFTLLATAVTIAVRYSAVRRQGFLQLELPNSPEIAVINYVTQQHKLLPFVAMVYVFRFASDQLKLLYNKCLLEFEHGDMSSLPELHALSAGLKASVTDQVCHGMEVARKACGGHSYSYASGLPSIWQYAVSMCTAEGENTVMYLQCAKFLVKSMKSPGNEAFIGNTNLLNEIKCAAITTQDFMDLNCLTACFKNRSWHVLKLTTSNMEKLVLNGTPKHQAWNLSTLRMVDATKAYTDHYFVSSYSTCVSGLKCSPPVKKVLTQLGMLYALHLINQNTGAYLMSGYLTSTQCELCQDAEVELLTSLRENSVGLVDAFDFSDELLNSCIGAFDGNVYERLYDWAKNAPFNKTQVHAKSYKLLRPYLLAGRDALKEKSKL